MRFKRSFCVLLSLMIIVSSSCLIAYASTQITLTRQAGGTVYTDSFSCKALVITTVTTYSKNVYGYLQCSVSGSWKDIPGYVATVNNNSFQLTLDNLNTLLFTSKSSYTCRGKLVITVPLTTYKNYFVVTAT